MKGYTFTITFKENYFRKGEILDVGTFKAKVIKTYPFNWWRKLLFKLGFSIKSCNIIKVKEL